MKGRMFGNGEVFLNMLWVTLKTGNHLLYRFPFVADLVNGSEKWKPRKHR